MILRNPKSLIRRYPVAVVLNFTGLVAALLAFALIFLLSRRRSRNFSRTTPERAKNHQI